tara:strand:+ start:252 stop:407 length:156 start_codon:yes stop_codon:yes gene_type:complete
MFAKSPTNRVKTTTNRVGSPTNRVKTTTDDGGTDKKIKVYQHEMKPTVFTV